MYGAQITHEPLDENGSLYTRTKKIRQGEIVYPIEEVYEIRDKVNSPLTEAVSIATLIKEIEDNPHIIEGGFRIEGYQHRQERGYYYVVKVMRTKVFSK